MYAVGSGSSSSSSSSSVRDRSGSSGSRAAADSGSSSSSSSSTGITGTCYKYNNWCFGIRELYDLGLDPAEVNNRWVLPLAQMRKGEWSTSQQRPIPRVSIVQGLHWTAGSLLARRDHDHVHVRFFAYAAVCNNPHRTRAQVFGPASRPASPAIGSVAVGVGLLQGRPVPGGIRCHRGAGPRAGVRGSHGSKLRQPDRRAAEV